MFNNRLPLLTRIYRVMVQQEIANEEGIANARSSVNDRKFRWNCSLSLLPSLPINDRRNEGFIVTSLERDGIEYEAVIVGVGPSPLDGGYHRPEKRVSRLGRGCKEALPRYTAYVYIYINCIHVFTHESGEDYCGQMHKRPVTYQPLYRAF